MRLRPIPIHFIGPYFRMRAEVRLSLQGGVICYRASASPQALLEMLAYLSGFVSHPSILRNPLA